MTERNPPLFLQASAHPSEDLRRWLASLGLTAAGVLTTADLAVTAATGLQVSVAAGRAQVPGSLATYQGSYLVDNRGVKLVTVAAGHATLPRKDRIVAKVEDAAYSGVINSWSIVVVPGTPNAAPTEPALPANSLELALLDVPAAAASIAAVTITDRRKSVLGNGVNVYASPAERLTMVPVPTPGLLTYVVNPGAGLAPRYEFWNATAGAYQRIAPAITVSTAAPTGGENGDIWVKVV